MTIRCLINAQHAPATLTTLFAASGKTWIDKFTANNTGAQTTLDVHIVPAGGSANPANRMLRVTIEQDAAYLCAEMVGHILETGDLIAVKAGAAASISIRASGRESV
jgi:hypothetical protein